MEQHKSNPFYQWEIWSDEELRQSELSSAKIELARRTNNVQDVELAINTLDNSTYNAFFIMTLAKTNEDLKVILNNLDAQLVPVILNRRNLSVEGNEDLFAYFKDRTKGIASGILGVFQECLQKLSEKVIKPNSNVFSTLLAYKFKSYEIHYLNYVWLKESISKRMSAKILSQLINAYAFDCEELTEQQKHFLRKELQETALVMGDTGYVSFSEYVQQGCDVIARSDSVWDFFRELYKEGVVGESMHTFLAVPLLETDKDRFAKLDFAEKCLSLDYSLNGVKDKEQLLQILEDNCMVGYTDLDNRTVSLETVDRLLHLGAVTMEVLPENLAIAYAKKYVNDFSFDYLLSSPDVDILQVKKIQISSYWCSVDLDTFFGVSDVSKSRALIDKTIYYAYENVESQYFVRYVSTLLQDSRVIALYDKEYLKEVAQLIVTEFSDCIAYNAADKMYKLLYSEEEYQRYCEEEEEKERQLKLEKEERRYNLFIEEVEEELSELDTLDSLLQYAVNDVSYQDTYESARIKLIYHKACELEEEPAVDVIELYCIFLRNELITIFDLQDVIAQIVSRVKEAIE